MVICVALEDTICPLEGVLGDFVSYKRIVPLLLENGANVSIGFKEAYPFPEFVEFWMDVFLNVFLT